MNTHTNNARLSKWVGKGEKGDGTEHTLASISIDHDGTGDDYKGKVTIATNAKTQDKGLELFKLLGFPIKK